MSRLNQLPNLRVEDFPTEQSWINRLFIQLNPFIQSVYNLFNNNIDFSTNIKSVSKDYSMTSFQSFSFLWPYTDVNPVTVEIIKATKGTGQTPTILLLAWSFDATTKQITVSRVTEVNAATVAALDGSQYNFTVRATV